MSKIFIFLFASLISTYSQVLDTLKYHYPYSTSDSITSLCAFIDDCYQPGYCEPFATWFTPDSSSPDTSFNVYTIKKIRICFTYAIGNTSISIYLGSSFPQEKYKIYQMSFLVDSTEVNPDFIDDGKYLYKELDVSGATELKNIPLDSSFWIQSNEKVFAVYSIMAKIGDEPYGSGHSFISYLPNNIGWEMSPCDWIIEAVIEYDKYSSLPTETKANIIQKAILYQNFPNPLNSKYTIIPYELNKPALVDIELFTSNGRTVGRYINQYQKGGRHEVRIDVSGLSSGTYFYVLRLDHKVVASRALTLVK